MAALGLGLLAVAGSAHAWEYPLLPHVHGLAFFPEQLNDATPTMAMLSAAYPDECWEVLSGELDSNLTARITIRRKDVPCDTGSTWTRQYMLGVLPAGIHHLTVRAWVVDGVASYEEVITVPFEVVGAPPPPPPPTYLVEWIDVQPRTAEPGEPVSIRIRGTTPFECTAIRDDHVVDPALIVATFDPAESCPDTSRQWERTFEMGSYPEGDHLVNIRFTVNAPESAYVREYTAYVRVREGGYIDSVTVLIQSVTVEPPAPHSTDSVTVRVRGRVPLPCAQVVWSGQWPTLLQVMLKPLPPCEDTSRAYEHAFHLGVLPAGNYQYQLTVIWQLTGTAAYRYHDFAFQVSDSGGPRPPPPPPPPPPPVDSLGQLLLAHSFEPPLPTANDEVTLSMSGRTEFVCPTVTHAEIVTPNRLAITLEPNSSCDDTSRVWTHAMALGRYPVGEHYIAVDFTVGPPWWRWYGTRHVLLRVSDPNAPPPPPPVDSLASTLSPNRPNPFSDHTSFAVSLADETPAELTVYDLSGRVVAQIHRGMLPRGTSQLSWNGRRSDGSRAPGGIYFYKLKLPHRVVTRRLVLLGTP